LTDGSLANIWGKELPKIWIWRIAVQSWNGPAGDPSGFAPGFQFPCCTAEDLFIMKVPRVKNNSALSGNGSRPAVSWNSFARTP
jgi:hypothetical protein